MTETMLDDDFLLGTAFQRAIKRVIVAVAPIIQPLIAIKIAPVAMACFYCQVVILSVESSFFGLDCIELTINCLLVLLT